MSAQQSASPSCVALITGSSRGVGASAARRLASRGWTVHLTYRTKRARAEAVLSAITQSGGVAYAHQLDVTDAASRASMVQRVREESGRLDALVLNASGGMEAGRPASYALELNRDAQLAMAQACEPLVVECGGRIVLVTSHEAHFHGADTALEPYAPVAASKQAGEAALRTHYNAPDHHPIVWLDAAPWEEAGRTGAPATAQALDPGSAPRPHLVVVSGDMIVGTATAMLLERARPGVTQQRNAQVGELPGTEEFGAVVAECADRPVPHGATVCLGGVDYAARGASPFASTQ